MCGGHSIACKTVNKIFDEQYSKPGYYDLVLIPSGATNIRITEVRIIGVFAIGAGGATAPPKQETR